MCLPLVDFGCPSAINIEMVAFLVRAVFLSSTRYKDQCKTKYKVKRYFNQSTNQLKKKKTNAVRMVGPFVIRQ